MLLTIIFLGKAGSGKGTQAHLLEEKINAKIIGTGDMLRSFAKSQAPTAKRIEKEVLLAGELAPSWFVSYLWIHEILHTDIKKNIVFDGSPRMLSEALLIDEVLDWAERVSPRVFLLDISDIEATKRLQTRRVCGDCKKNYQGTSAEAESGTCSCGGKLARRSDDTPESIKNRLTFFQTDVVPVIEHYRDKKWLVRIDGEQSVDLAHRGILENLNKIR